MFSADTTITSHRHSDRHAAKDPIAMEVINAAAPFVDILCFQGFDTPVEHLDHWQKKTGKLVFLADAAGVNRQSKSLYTPSDGA